MRGWPVLLGSRLSEAGSRHKRVHVNALGGLARHAGTNIVLVRMLKKFNSMQNRGKAKEQLTVDHRLMHNIYEFLSAYKSNMKYGDLDFYVACMTNYFCACRASPPHMNQIITGPAK